MTEQGYAWIEHDLSNVEVPEYWFNIDGSLNTEAMQKDIKNDLIKGVNETTNRYSRRLIY